MAHNDVSKSSNGASMSKQVVAGTLATATVNTGGKLMTKLAKHPLLVFGAGIVAGYFVYKYRKEIISGATKTIDAGKDFVLHQKENLEDIVAEAKEGN
ncbi:hypothetical protein QZJ86_14845 [Methylomonas montana]|uniref:hypothetical protein n=1 Tax=Methylomonas montana TaxID=3058963 RepID=UPI00265AF631|nr:hypothetical protein [Methylomonas montana]WKJ89294.1 hypothetical protein QZJ86_14845 [Methylomonas montana]